MHVFIGLSAIVPIDRFPGWCCLAITTNLVFSSGKRYLLEGLTNRDNLTITEKIIGQGRSQHVDLGSLPLNIRQIEAI